MTKWLSGVAFAVLFSTIAPNGVLMAQENAATLAMSGEEFERWILTNAEKKGAVTQTVAFCQSILARLKADREVTDRSILRCVDAHITVDGRVATPRYAPTKAFISALVPLIGTRDALRQQLLERQGSVEVAVGDFDAAAKAFDAASRITPGTPSVERDVQRLVMLVRLGQSLLSSGRKSEAAATFEEVLAYKWYTLVNQPDELQRARDQYLLAGRGLIDSRRSDLAALERITFVPAAYETLGPLLERALREAKELP